MKRHVNDLLWDFWCVISVLGIWPRFIEPNLLSITKLTLPIKKLPKALRGLKIAHLSDLHLNSRTPQFFLNKLSHQIRKHQPDLILFTGDFLCNAQMNNPERLKTLLNQMKAPYGCYAILGNHDYKEKIFINQKGDYDIETSNSSLISQGFKRLFSSSLLNGKVTKEAQLVPPHPELVQLLNHTPFELLNNCTKQIKIKETLLNLTGLGEYMLGRCLPEHAFQGYHSDFPGIVLTHNPDSLPKLKQYPGDIILCGHTHGAQINLPYLWRSFTQMEQPNFKRGLFSHQNKWVYVNRGLGGVMPFRWFSLPELLFLTLDEKI